MKCSSEDIVISGISGRFPESENVDKFKGNLFRGVDMVTEDDRRWPRGLLDMPARSGKLGDLTSFDASFFGVHAKQAHAMDPQLRILLELTQEAIIDAGINPAEIRGSKIGVFIGITNSATKKNWSFDSEVNKYGLLGGSRAMFANRISYAFDFNGPSCAIDTACSSSLFAMHQAIEAVKSGACDSAIVGGVTVNLKPEITMQFNLLNMLSPDGKCKSFDASGDGYVRSEAAVVIFLQKTQDAKRIYATVVNSKTNTDGYKSRGVTFPSRIKQNELLQQIYGESRIDPREVAYIEVHGTGTKAGDPEEVNAIAQHFCKDRSSPLLIGSVKSNMGHSEPVSGLCSVVKVLIAMESGMIPANLHYKEPNPDIPALTDGSIKVVDKPTPFDGGLIGVNSFGFGGTNVHVILKSNPKQKSLDASASVIPKIVGVSGRTKEACELFLNDIKEHNKDNEFVGLVHRIHTNNIVGHDHRGFIIIEDSKKESVLEINEYQPSYDRRPIWFVFSGMGTQWPGMGKEMMTFAVFAKSIHRSADILKAERIDLIDLLNNCTTETFENVIKSYVLITSIQIALVDLLTSIGITPDGIVGVSAGELACAYADGAFTHEQTILSAYWRGKSIVDSNISGGAAATVGLSREETSMLCPPEIQIAGHIDSVSTTVAGPTEILQAFVNKIQQKDIFIKTFNTSGVAFHTSYIKPAEQNLYAALEKIIPNPKERSSKWISSSVPDSDRGTEAEKYSDAKYFVNNLLSPVYFYETLKYIPENAITIEIAPHVTMQTVLKRAFPSTATHLALQKRAHTNNVEFFLTNIGRLFNAGGQPDLSKLYPSIDFPVSRGTPMLNSMITWDHSQQWEVADFSTRVNKSEDTIFEIDLSKDEDAYLYGHALDGRIIFPATGYLALVWKTFAKLNATDADKTPITFKDVEIRRATILPNEGKIKLIIQIFSGSGNFEICEGGSIVVTGKVFKKDYTEDTDLLFRIKQKHDLLDLSKEDVYKELRLRGYDYSGVFQGIASSDNFASKGEIDWNSKWIPFLDSMLQFYCFGRYQKDLYLPTRLQYISIDPIKHLAMIKYKMVDVKSDFNLNIVKSGGVEIKGMKWSLAPRRALNKIQATPRLEKYVFVQYDNTDVLDSDQKQSEYHALTVLCQIVIENLGIFKIKGIEASYDGITDTLVSPTVVDILKNEPSVTYDLQVAFSESADTHMPFLEKYNLTTLKKDISSAPIGQDLHFVIATDVLSQGKSKVLSNLAASVTSNGYLLLIENGPINETPLKEFELVVVAIQRSYGKSYYLLTKKIDKYEPVVIQLTGKDFSWLENVKRAIKQSQTDGQQTLLVSQGEELFGIVGLMNCLRREAGGQHFRYVYIPDSKEPKFSLKDPIFASQLQKGLVANVSINQQWGSYRHLSFSNECEIKTVQSEHSYVNTLVRGDLSSLRWIESPLAYYNPKICSSHELCTVYYAPLNFRDIMLATGKLPPDALPLNLVGQDCVLGLEFAGRDSEGKRVMGMVPAKGLATSVLPDKSGFVWKIPENWSMEEAATIPVCYATSYYALFVRGRIRSGESVLIHSGTGGVGLASIALALDAGCEVFTTVGTPEKREFLKKRFPQLTDRNIGNSRNTTFEQLILDETNGRGVDLVLNSLADDKLQASVRCLASNGRFLEIGKYDLSNNSSLGMAIFLKNISFCGILLDALFDDDSEDRKLVQNLVSEGIKNGSVKPLPTTVFSEHEIEQGFRFMTSGKHIGKVLLKIRDEEKNDIVTPIPKTVVSIPRTYMNPEKSYILVGGLGGFGLELAYWMISRGARYIVLTSRSGIRTGYQALCIHRLKEMGVTVVVSRENVITIESAKNLLFDCNKIAPVGGIFNLAAVLHNDIIGNLNESHFKDVTMCKIDATKYLDIASRELCPSLEYFVVFSSLACGRGLPGQTNYGLANSTMERIVEIRKSMGLPGLAIQWGAIGDVGLVMDTVGDNNTDVGGTIPQRMISCLDIMDKFLKLPNDFSSCVSSMVVNDKNNFNNLSESQADLSTTIANLFGIKDVNKVNRSTIFSDLGLDSLMTTEIKQICERDYDIVLSDEEIRQMTFAKLDQLSDNDVAVLLPHSELVLRDPLIHLDNNVGSGDPIFFIQILNMKNLAMMLNRPTYALQITQDVPITSIPDCAKFFINLMKSIQPKGPYTIIAYSFGTCVAVEMALQLEAEGDTVTLNLLDGSPDFVLNGIKAYNKRLDPNSEYAVDFQRKVMCYFTKWINLNVDKIQLYQILRKINNYDEMMNKFVEIVGTTTLTPEELKAEAMLCMKKMMAASIYKPTGKLSGPVILFKASQRSDIHDHDYGLTEICRQDNLTIKEIEGDHHSITTTDSYRKVVGSFIV